MTEISNFFTRLPNEIVEKISQRKKEFGIVKEQQAKEAFIKYFEVNK